MRSLPVREKIREILFDMDGTIVDFEEQVKIRTGRNVFTHNVIDSSWIDQYLEKEVPTGLFTELNPLPDFEKMKNLIYFFDEQGYDIAFLSSCTHQWYLDIYKQKRIWLDKFGLDDYPLYGVKHSHEKGQYATEASLLIDDYHVSVDSFVNAGGHAIKHTTAENTILQLKQIGLLL
jgi:FMN phosphatase YigB (HAD superfamily)